MILSLCLVYGNGIPHNGPKLTQVPVFGMPEMHQSLSGPA